MALLEPINLTEDIKQILSAIDSQLFEKLNKAINDFNSYFPSVKKEQNLFDANSRINSKVIREQAIAESQPKKQDEDKQHEVNQQNDVNVKNMSPEKLNAIANLLDSIQDNLSLIRKKNRDIDIAVLALEVEEQIKLIYNQMLSAIAAACKEPVEQGNRMGVYPTDAYFEKFCRFIRKYRDINRYGMVFLTCKENFPSSAALEKIAKNNNDLPILFKKENEYFIFGRQKDGEWRLTKLDHAICERRKSYFPPYEGKYVIKSYTLSERALYEHISAKEAHYHKSINPLFGYADVADNVTPQQEDTLYRGTLHIGFDKKLKFIPRGIQKNDVPDFPAKWWAGKGTQIRYELFHDYRKFIEIENAIQQQNHLFTSYQSAKNNSAALNGLVASYKAIIPHLLNTLQILNKRKAELTEKFAELSSIFHGQSRRVLNTMIEQINKDLKNTRFKLSAVLENLNNEEFKFIINAVLRDHTIVNSLKPNLNSSFIPNGFVTKVSKAEASLIAGKADIQVLDIDDLSRQLEEKYCTYDEIIETWSEKINYHLVKNDVEKISLLQKAAGMLYQHIHKAVQQDILTEVDPANGTKKNPHVQFIIDLYDAVGEQNFKKFFNEKAEFFLFVKNYPGLLSENACNDYLLKPLDKYLTDKNQPKQEVKLQDIFTPTFISLLRHNLITGKDHGDITEKLTKISGLVKHDQERQIIEKVKQLLNEPMNLDYQWQLQLINHIKQFDSGAIQDVSETDMATQILANLQKRLTMLRDPQCLTPLVQMRNLKLSLNSLLEIEYPDSSIRYAVQENLAAIDGVLEFKHDDMELHESVQKAKKLVLQCKERFSSPEHSLRR